MEWKFITTGAQLDQINQRSSQIPQLIFKHSTRCPSSSMVKQRLERNSVPVNMEFHFLDLIKFRHISNLIAETYHVHHESPQVLLIRNGECIFEESHYAISMQEIISQLGGD